MQSYAANGHKLIQHYNKKLCHVPEDTNVKQTDTSNLVCKFTAFHLNYKVMASFFYKNNAIDF